MSSKTERVATKEPIQEEVPQLHTPSLRSRTRVKPGELPAPEGEENPYSNHVILDKGWVRGKKFLTKKKLGFAGKQKPEAVEK